jgi:hypothetical protein
VCVSVRKPVSRGVVAGGTHVIAVCGCLSNDGRRDQ